MQKNNDEMQNIHNLTLKSKQQQSDSASMEREQIHLCLGGVYKNENDAKDYQLIEFMEDINQGLFKNIKTKRNAIMSIHDFKNVITIEKNIPACVDTNEVIDEDWDIAHKRFIAIKPLINGGQFITSIEDRANEINISSKTLIRWINAYEFTGSITSLIERKDEKRLKPHIEKLIQDVIKEHYLTIKRPSSESTIRAIHKICFEKGFDNPSKNTIRRRLAQISEKDHLKGRGYRKPTLKDNSYKKATDDNEDADE